MVEKDARRTARCRSESANGFGIPQPPLRDAPAGPAAGCPFGTVGDELTPNDELMRQDLNLIFEVIRHRLATFFREKAAERLAEQVNEEPMADFCLTPPQGAVSIGKIRRNSEPAEAAVREALRHLKEYTKARRPRAEQKRGRERSSAPNTTDDQRDAPSD